MSHKHPHLEYEGYNALLDDHNDLAKRLAAAEEDLAAVKQLLADLRLPELVRELEALGCTVTLRIEPTPTADREFVADLGGGWQIVRTPTAD
jgi:hypothetical protein